MAEAEKSKSPEPVKGILKHNHEDHEHPAVKWDEMNILETYHPANKDYGHMKIDEPPTPYNYEFENEREVSENQTVNPESVADKLVKTSPRKDHESGESEEEDDSHLSDAAKEKKKEFRDHRKKHYNEFESVKKARELIAQELADLENEDDDNNTEKMDTSNS